MIPFSVACSKPGALSYPGVVAGKHFLCYRGDVIQEEFVPFLFIVDLIHVDIDGGHVLIAALDSVILGKTT